MDTSKFPGKKAALTMRNYLVKSGLSVLLPEVRNATTKKVISKSETRTQGSHVAVKSPVRPLIRLTRVVLMDILGFYLLGFATSAIYHGIWIAFFSFGIYRLVLELAVRKIDKLLRSKLFKDEPYEKIVNSSVRIPAAGQGFGPNHIYQIFVYDATQQDVEISAGLPGPKAIYTSINCYDRYTHPLNEYLYDETIQAEGKTDQTDVVPYKAYLTLSPSYLPHRNEINVSGCPRGLCIVRLLHPHDEATKEACRPVIAAVPRVK